TDPALTQGTRRLRRLLDRLEGHWLGDLAAIDSRGAAGADPGVPAASTASWLRHRLRLSHAAAASGGGCGRPRPGKAWSPCKACWTQRPARPC
ncbi:MAG TPA: hypothetical protein VHM23_30725, partial [Actinomycetota bacterium]|nr:hypothetical protein [Actinomycetota bacterium]